MASWQQKAEKRRSNDGRGHGDADAGGARAQCRERAIVVEHGDPISCHPTTRRKHQKGLEVVVKSQNPSISAVTPQRRDKIRVREYFELTKPRVVSLIVFTAVVGMLLSTPGLVPWDILILATAGIALAAGAAATINHFVEQRSDALMARTRDRPLPTGRINTRGAIVFAAVLAIASMLILGVGVNVLTAGLTFVSLIGYSIIYTVFLKRRTPQNIVIGGAAGAASTAARLDRRHRGSGERCVAAVPYHLCVDAAALLGARALSPPGVRRCRHSHAAGDPRQQVHAAVYPALHDPAGGGDGVAVRHAHGGVYVFVRGVGAERGVFVLRLEVVPALQRCACPEDLLLFDSVSGSAICPVVD